MNRFVWPHKVVTSEALEPGSMLVSRGRRESLSGVVRKALLLNLAMVFPAPNRADRPVTSGAGGHVTGVIDHAVSALWQTPAELNDQSARSNLSTPTRLHCCRRQSNTTN